VPTGASKRNPRLHPCSRWLFGALGLLPLLSLACSTAFEGTLLITTTGSETVTRRDRAELNPLGDRLTLPEKVEAAFLRIAEGEEASLPTGACVEVLLEETAELPGVRTRILVNGEEKHRSTGRLRVTVRWRIVEERRLPPKEEAVPIALEADEVLPIDRTVMYVPMPESRVWGVETHVRILGPDKERLKWEPEGTPVNGRVRGRVKVLPKKP
jgi:hypothetical protein